MKHVVQKYTPTHSSSTERNTFAHVLVFNIDLTINIPNYIPNTADFS